MTEDEMTERDAIDYVEYNIAGCWVGDMTPILVRNLDETEKFIVDKKTESVFNDKTVDEKEINYVARVTQQQTNSLIVGKMKLI